MHRDAVGNTVNPGILGNIRLKLRNRLERVHTGTAQREGNRGVANEGANINDLAVLQVEASQMVDIINKDLSKECCYLLGIGRADNFNTIRFHMKPILPPLGRSPHQDTTGCRRKHRP